jgi:chromatin structure-remodeling complex subunit RSC1/2
MILYVCEHRYKDDVKSFKKIKNWNSCVPEEIRKNEYDFVPYPKDRIDTLPRIKSPFVRGLRGPGGIGDALEKEEEDQAKYHSLPGGETASAHRARMAREVSGPIQDSPPPEDVAPSALTMYGDRAQFPTPPAQATPASSRAPLEVQQSPPTNRPLSPASFPFIGSGLSPAEIAVGEEKFARLPENIGKH